MEVYDLAKEKERKALTRGRSAFNLIGRVKVTDKTFNLDNTYSSGWTDNRMYVGVDCGEGNYVYGEMAGGFFPEEDSVLRGFSRDRDADGKSKMVEVAWEDRFDEDLLDTISDMSFITVGVEKDVKDKTVYKKFLSAYDAVEYLNEHLEDGMIVNVKGNIKYSEYDGNVSTKKEITSIALSKVEDEADFKATFTQTVLIDSKSIGKKDKEKNTVTLDAYVVDYVGNPKIDGKKVSVKQNVTFPKSFEVAIHDNPEVTAKMLERYFKVKKGFVNEITVVGKLIEGSSTVNITDDDIPDDIKELIELGLYTDEEAKNRMAVGNNSGDKRMVILKPDIVYVGKDEDRKPTVALEEKKYEESDLYFYEQALKDAGVDLSEEEDDDVDADVDSDDDLLAMLDM